MNTRYTGGTGQAIQCFDGTEVAHAIHDQRTTAIRRGLAGDEGAEGIPPSRDQLVPKVLKRQPIASEASTFRLLTYRIAKTHPVDGIVLRDGF